MFQTQLNRLLMAVVVFNLCFIVGCHRSYYRRQADAEVQRLIREKASDPQWNSADGSIEIDPRSRMFNPFSQDHPPIPPDDAASHQFMHKVDGKEGYPHWHANGDTDAVENPEWRAYLPTNERGQVVLTIERAYQLALIHSPEYQRQRELLYSSALDVSFERFGFDARLFSGYNSLFTSQGRFRGSRERTVPAPAPVGTSSSVLQSQLGAEGGGATLRRLGITGTEFVVGLANTILFNFAGPDTGSASTAINFSIIQPLLRGAGRERIMEALTQTERTLLANVRQFERFRRDFYLTVAIGANRGGSNVSSSSFYGLLLQQQEIRNRELNVRQLEGVLKQFREFFDKDRIDAVQLKRFEIDVYQQQSQLLAQKTNYQTTVDSFKILLGLPPDLDVIVEDKFLDEFKLISDQLNERVIEITKLRDEAGEVLSVLQGRLEGFDIDEAKRDPDFVWPDDLAEQVGKLEAKLDRAIEVLGQVATKDADQVNADIDKLANRRESRLEYLRKLKAEIDAGRIISSVDPELFAANSIPNPEPLKKEILDPVTDKLEFIEVDGQQRPAPQSILKRAGLLKEELSEVRLMIQGFEDAQQQATQPQIFTMIQENFLRRIPGLLAELNNLPLDLSRLQAFSRSSSIQISPVTIDAEQAIRVARCLRRDWMNERANLVDQYRNIEFVADQLEAGVDLVFRGDLSNAPRSNNPLELRYETGQIQAGFRIDAPITRLGERNDYRRALISYQQSRRAFYQYEDGVKAELRDLIRNIKQNKVLFELNRRQLQASIDQLEINRLELDEPIRIGAASSALGPTTALNLTNAINSLNNAQNRFVRDWLSYEVLRRNLDFNMGTMMLDEMGQWLDPGEIDPAVGLNAAAVMGIEIDCQFCEDIGTSYLQPLEPVDPNDDSTGNSVIDSGDSPRMDMNEYRLRRQRSQLKPGEMTPEQRALELERQRLLLEQDLLDRQREQLQQELPQPEAGAIPDDNGFDSGLIQPAIEEGNSESVGQPFSQPVVAPIGARGTKPVPGGMRGKPSDVSTADTAQEQTARQVSYTAAAGLKPLEEVADTGDLTRERQSSKAVEATQLLEVSQPKSGTTGVTEQPIRTLMATPIKLAPLKLSAIVGEPTDVDEAPPHSGGTPQSDSAQSAGARTQTIERRTTSEPPRPTQKPSKAAVGNPTPRSESFGGLLNRF